MVRVYGQTIAIYSNCLTINPYHNPNPNREHEISLPVARETVDTMTGSFFSVDLQKLKVMHYLYIVASDGGWDNHSDKEGGRKLNFKVKVSEAQSN